MSDQIILKSVGSYLDTNGHVGPLDKDGHPDLYPHSCVDLEELDTDWITKLSDEDRGAVNAILEDHRLPILPTSEPRHVSEILPAVLDGLLGKRFN